MPHVVMADIVFTLIIGAIALVLTALTLRESLQRSDRH